MKFLSQLTKKDLSGKTVLVRIDLNIKDVELNKNNLRVQAVLTTIKFLLENGARVVLLSHRGRPDLRLTTYDLRLSLKPFIKIYEKLLKQPVKFVDFGAIFKDSGEKTIKNSDVILLENLRFFSGEEKNDVKFAKQLAGLGDIYVNDAFAVSHRANASVAAITKFIPSYVGLLLEKEIKNLDAAAKNGRHPFAVILGGEKISDKIGLINNFISKADYFLLGGGIAINFFMAQGLPIGDSICEADKVEFARKSLKKYGKEMILPTDVCVDNRKILDIGPEAVKEFSAIIKKAKTIIWNGPMGLIEDKRFKKGSDGIVKAVMSSDAFVVIGGGETATLLEGKKLHKNIFVSTGGGAMLEYLSGKKLPGIEVLNRSKS